jgi:hypothetical protein
MTGFGPLLNIFPNSDNEIPPKIKTITRFH